MTTAINQASAAADSSLPASRLYKVTSIEKTDAPDGSDGQSWYQYEVKNARSTITGRRQGSRQQVRRHAEAFAKELNARANGAGLSPWASRKKA